MCFYVSEDPNEKSIRIAEKDIVCFKYGTKVKLSDATVFKAPCYKFFYWRNTPYKIKTKGLRPKWQSVNSGFHSYVDKDDAVDCCSIYDDETIGRFIIPKGAKYFLNSTRGELVSDTIIFKNFINLL